MVGACQQNSGIFLVRSGGLERDAGGGRGLGRDKMPVTKSPGRQRTRSETKLRVYCCEKQDEKPANRGEMPAEVEAETGMGCRRRNHRGRQRAWSGQGSDEMPAGAEAGQGQDAGGKITGQAAVPATKSHGQVAGSERPGTGRDAGEDRGWGQDKMPAGAEAWAGTRCRRENHRAGSGLGAARDQTGCRRGPRFRPGQDAGGKINSKEGAL